MVCSPIGKMHEASRNSMLNVAALCVDPPKATGFFGGILAGVEHSKISMTSSWIAYLFNQRTSKGFVPNRLNQCLLLLTMIDGILKDHCLFAYPRKSILWKYFSSVRTHNKP